jgi:coenzyme F420-0:L-glutamate ligase/coenzyme F420-1:gamma-L-glutamate ligase
LTVRITITALEGVPAIEAGCDLASVILDAVHLSACGLQDGDAVVLAQKVVSKAENRMVRLETVEPSMEAVELAGRCHKDPRLVQLILTEAAGIMRVRPGVLIVRHRLGLVLANAGIDQSNVDHGGGEAALLLPIDPDASCAALRTAIRNRTGCDVAVLIIDSLGRAWRNGTAGTAIGSAGVSTLLDLRGRRDLFGRTLQTSELGVGDEIAAAASLAMGQADEGTPVVLVRGVAAFRGEGRAVDLVRPEAMDLFP